MESYLQKVIDFIKAEIMSRQANMRDWSAMIHFNPQHCTDAETLGVVGLGLIDAGKPGMGLLVGIYYSPNYPVSEGLYLGCNCYSVPEIGEEECEAWYKVLTERFTEDNEIKWNLLNSCMFQDAMEAQEFDRG